MNDDEILKFYVCWKRGGNRADFQSVCWLWFFAIKEYLDENGDVYSDAFNMILGNYARLSVAVSMDGLKRVGGYEHVDQVAAFDFRERDRKRFDAVIYIDLDNRKICFPEFADPIDKTTEFLSYGRK